MSMLSSRLSPRGITFDAALRDLGSADVKVRIAAADALGDTAGEDRPRAIAALQTALDDARPEVRAAAALALGALGEREVVPALVAHIGDTHPEVRQSAIIALGRLGDAAAVPPLRQALLEGPADVRFQATRSLAELDPQGAFDPLCAAIRDPDAEVRESAAEALAVVGDRRATGWLAELLEDARPGTRFAAASALASFEDDRGLDVLIAALGERDRTWEAIEGLEAIGGPKALAAMVALTRRFFVAPVMRVRAAAAIVAMAPDDPAAGSARAFLDKSLRSRRPEVRGLAEECLRQLTVHS